MARHQITMRLKGLNKISEIKEIIEKAENITITSHRKPDGDAVGSVLGLYNYLIEHFESIGIYKEIQVVLKDSPTKFSFLKNFEIIKEDVEGNIDLLIVLDFQKREKLGLLAYLENLSNKILIIDHHKGNPDFGDYAIVKHEEPSNTSLLYNVYKEIKNL